MDHLGRAYNVSRNVVSADTTSTLRQHYFDSTPIPTLTLQLQHVLCADNDNGTGEDVAAENGPVNFRIDVVSIIHNFVGNNKH